MKPSLKDFSVLTFDCYGTLIDWESGIWDAFQPLIMANKANELDRKIVLQAFAKAEHWQQSETPNMIYADILKNVHIKVALDLGLTTNQELNLNFAHSVPYWPAFPDTADALRILNQHYKLVILSNVSRQGFAASNKKLGVEFDVIYTAQDIGFYKPTPKNFEYMLENLDKDFGIKSQDILHTAQSLFHDHVPAKSFGLACAWIDRQGLQQSDNWGATAVVEKRPEVDFIFGSMMEMVQAL